MSNIIGIGLDATDIHRIADTIERYGERFLRRIFSDGEIAYCTRRRVPAIHFAGRFASKEAAMALARATPRAFCGATSRSSGTVVLRNCSCMAAPDDGSLRLAAARRFSPSRIRTIWRWRRSSSSVSRARL
jgi:hypothetical protein